MQLRQSERKQAKIKMALQGSAGSGKTFSSLLLAKGLTNGDFSKVAIIDTENGSADLYAHLGNYNVVSLKPPFTPQQYVEAITLCENSGMEVIIIDSISHCWDYLLDYHSSLAGNSFTNWAKIKPLEKQFVDKILQSNAHIIATMRTKQDYVLNQKDGKMIIALDILGSINGTIYLVGIPNYNPITKEIYFDQMDYVLNTKSILMKSANWLMQGTILKKIQENCRYSIKGNLEEGKQNMKPYLSNYSPMKGVFVNGSLNDFEFEKVELTDKAIIAFITTSGKMNIKIDGME